MLDKKFRMEPYFLFSLSTEAPKDWKVIEYDSERISFQMIPSVSSTILRYRVKVIAFGLGNPRVRDDSGSLTNEVYGFEPYTTLYLYFTAYIYSEKLSRPLFGETLRVNITSNVEGELEID